MIDLHCHLLPGIDDGPQTMEDSVALARAAEAAGIQTVVATPHVSWRYFNDADTIARLVDEVKMRLLADGVTLEVRAGAEIATTRITDVDAAHLPRLSLGGGPWLLVEPPFTPVTHGLDTALLDLQRRGHRILLAHPERCHAFHRDPRMLESLVRAGVLTSITAGSLVGRFGGEVRRFALRLMRDGMVHNVASDAHDDRNRPPGMAAELDRAGFSPLVEWLTDTVPSAILSGEEIPPRPEMILPDVERSWRPWSRRR